MRQSEGGIRPAGAHMRLWMVALVSLAAVSACRDNGLPDRNLPLDQAQNREFGYTVYENSTDTPALAMGGRHWIRSLPVETIPSHVLVPVGNAEGTQLYARRGEVAPYSRLYEQVAPGRWAPYLRLN